MAEITEIEKLRPELLKLSVPELERRKSEIEMAIVAKAKQEADERRAKEREEAQGLHEDFIRIVTRMKEIGFLYPRIETVLTKESGEFVPGQFLKRPR